MMLYHLQILFNTESGSVHEAAAVIIFSGVLFFDPPPGHELCEIMMMMIYICIYIFVKI
jgi:hypothetical protein